MENLLKNRKVKIGDAYETPFMNKYGIYQDGTVPFCRDKNGKLWAISGIFQLGHIAMFCGNDLTDIKETYPIKLNFELGHADEAFNKVRYPEGVKSRGNLWPFGLYICPKTNRFFVFFHNETGWYGKGTAYDALGLCEKPHFDSDFRHVGLMHSDDEGRTWEFDRWVLTAEDPCFCELYNPENDIAIGQKADIVSLGSGDFSLFCDDEYIYLLYNIVKVDVNKGVWKECNTYIARTRKREDGFMGDFVKYYNGSFCEAGNMGKETAIATNSWHSRIAYSKYLGSYILSACPINPDEPDLKKICGDYMEVRTSKDILSWSEPIYFEKDGKKFGNHYQAIISLHGVGNTAYIEGKDFTVLHCHNGTDVKGFDLKIED